MPNLSVICKSIFVKSVFDGLRVVARHLAQKRLRDEFVFFFRFGGRLVELSLIFIGFLARNVAVVVLFFAEFFVLGFFGCRIDDVNVRPEGVVAVSRYKRVMRFVAAGKRNDFGFIPTRIDVESIYSERLCRGVLTVFDFGIVYFVINVTVVIVEVIVRALSDDEVERRALIWSL